MFSRQMRQKQSDYMYRSRNAIPKQCFYKMHLALKPALHLMLDTAVRKAQELVFQKIYLFTFDASIASYYIRFGWEQIGLDIFKSKPVILMEKCLFITSMP